MTGDRRFSDPYGGLADLARGLLRTPAPPEESFADDPLRMLRAARFVSTLGAQVNLGVARMGARGALTLDGNLSYWRRKPDSAAANQWGLSLGGRRLLTQRR